MTNNTVFLFWHGGEENMPIFMKLNLENIKNRLKNTTWNIIVTSLQKESPNYIENYISLPSYFFKIPELISDKKGIYGNQSDIIRLRLLEKYGGCYFDTSTILLRDSIEEINLYKKLKKNSKITFAGYSNITFSAKDEMGNHLYDNAKDGIELGVLFARKGSAIIVNLNKEIDAYWNWKNDKKNYREYTLFQPIKMKNIIFLNEYHIHYSLYQMVIRNNNSLLSEIEVQSIHMQGKENSLKDGPYSVQDRFCRGKSTYEPASAELLYCALKEGRLETYNGISTTLSERINIFFKSELLIFPGYLRKTYEEQLRNIEDFLSAKYAFRSFYKL